MSISAYNLIANTTQRLTSMTIPTCGSRNVPTNFTFSSTHSRYAYIYCLTINKSSLNPKCIRFFFFFLFRIHSKDYIVHVAQVLRVCIIHSRYQLPPAIDVSLSFVWFAEREGPAYLCVWARVWYWFWFCFCMHLGGDFQTCQGEVIAFKISYFKNWLIVFYYNNG